MNIDSIGSINAMWKKMQETIKETLGEIETTYSG